MYKNIKTKGKMALCHPGLVHQNKQVIDEDVDEPFRAILPPSPGRKPWVNHWNIFF